MATAEARAFELHDSVQSALAPHGAAAAEIAGLSWLMFAGAAVVFAIVAACAALALFGPERWRARLAKRAAVVGLGIAFPAVTLTALLVHTLLAAAAIERSGAAPALRIEVVGEQWWWRVRYLDAAGATDFVLANEIRLPAGVAVELLLKSADVIHSFWVPSLAGKMDMIPGRVNRLALSAERTGVFRGQCAEYCGGPHAHMALFVVVEDTARFEAWREQQRAPAQAATPRAREGEALFLERGCAVCHTVRGTPAAGTLGPDLTHVGSRLSIGAGLLPNNAGTLAAWIPDSHRVKPGNLMPRMTVYSGAELQRVVEYLQALQ